MSSTASRRERPNPDLRLGHHRELRAERSARRVAQPGARLRQHALQSARRHQRRQRRPPEGRLDVLRRHAERPRGRAAGARRHDVPGDAVPEHRLRARPDQAGRADQVVVRAQPDAGLDRQGLLRHRQPRRRLRQRQDHLQPARHAHRRRRRQDRQGGLAHEDGRRHARRDDDHGAARGRQQGLRRQQRRRARRLGLARRARRRHRQGALARLQHRHRRAGARSAPTSSRSTRG